MRKLSQKITGVFSDKNSLRAKILASVGLSTIVFIFQLIGRIVSTVILTRILAPDIFGVFAVVITFIYILEMFSDLGVRSLILTKEDDLDDSFLRSCWTAQILRGVLIFVVCALLAAGVGWAQNTTFFPLGSSYSNPTVPVAIAAIGIGSIINGFASPAKFIYEREMKFRAVSIENLIVMLSTTVITIFLALWLRNVWALVAGGLLGACITLILSYTMFKGPKMRLNWSVADFKIIIARGKWIIGHSALTALMTVADRLILGFAMSASSFGFYYIARQIVGLIEQFLDSIHAQMGLQVFTALQKDTEIAAFRRRYYQYRILFDGLSMLGAGTLLTFAPTFVSIIYDDRYASTAVMIQILALGLILVGPGLLREAYSAQRKFREMTLLSLVRTTTIWIGLLIAEVVLDSTTIALFVVALHRIPETTILLMMGRSESWVDWIYELRLLPLVPVGAAIGWGMAFAWEHLV